MSGQDVLIAVTDARQKVLREGMTNRERDNDSVVRS
jgi:hypothetical protein